MILGIGWAATPRLGKGGVGCTQRKCREASLAVQTGWFVQLTDYSVGLTNHPVRSIKGAFATFSCVASTPPFPRRGVRLTKLRSATAIGLAGDYLDRLHGEALLQYGSLIEALGKVDDGLRFKQPATAFEQLDRALDLRDPGVVHLAVGPQWDSLRADQRFTERLRKMALPVI